MKIAAPDLVRHLTATLDQVLAQAVVDSYVEMQQRFLAGDWKPTELDGGRLCEAVSRCLLQLDQGTIKYFDLPGAVRKTLLDGNVSHNLGQKDREHITKVIEVAYKFRSDRGAVHISPIHSANFMDSMLIVHAGKWMFAELLRLAWKQDQKTIGEVIAQIVQLEHSLIHELDGQPMVLSTKLSTPEEVLLLLNHAPNNRLSRVDIQSYAKGRTRNAVSTAISRLVEAKEVRVATDGEVALTPIGQKRIVETILPKHG